jgi:ERCC4-type nuclease
MGLLTAVLDSREPKHVLDGVQRALRDHHVNSSVATLACGDVQAVGDDGALLCIERKTPSDFLNSLRSGRLYEQLAACHALTPWCYLIVTGDLHFGANDKAWYADGSALGYRETGWQWSSLQGALLDLQEAGVYVVTVNGEIDYAAAVLRLGNRSRAGVRVPPPRPFGVVDDDEAILAALPGVGPERARALLRHCGTVGWALEYLTDATNAGSHDAVPGVSGGTKRLVNRALGLDEGCCLAIVDDADFPALNAARLARAEALPEVDHAPAPGAPAQGAAQRAAQGAPGRPAAGVAA